MNFDRSLPGQPTVKFPSPGGTILINGVMDAYLSKLIWRNKKDQLTEAIPSGESGHLRYRPIQLNCARVGDPSE